MQRVDFKFEGINVTLTFIKKQEGMPSVAVPM